MRQNQLLSCSLPMAGVKTRKHSYSKLSELVGSGKDFLPSEVPTLRAVIQKGILIREGVLVELGKAKTDLKCQVHTACHHQGEEHQDQGGEAVVDGGGGETWKSRERNDKEG